MYAIARDRVRTRPPQLIIDQSVQEGRKSRPSKLIRRKNDEVLVLALPSDVHDAIRWHIQQGFCGRRFLFSRNGTWSQKIQEHERPLRRAQEALGLRVISHHKLGRHSVASQAASGGHSIKHIQTQLGHRDERSTHRYARLSSGAQLRLVETLTPETPPHAIGHGIVRASERGTDEHTNTQPNETQNESRNAG